MALADTLTAIQIADPSSPEPFPGASYDRRNELVYLAISQALALGYPAGIRPDKLDPAWPVAFIELPTGQVSWHLPAYAGKWDGHSTDDKYHRCRSYTRLTSIKPVKRIKVT